MANGAWGYVTCECLRVPGSRGDYPSTDTWGFVTVAFNKSVPRATASTDQPSRKKLSASDRFSSF